MEFAVVAAGRFHGDAPGTELAEPVAQGAAAVAGVGEAALECAGIDEDVEPVLADVDAGDGLGGSWWGRCHALLGILSTGQGDSREPLLLECGSEPLLPFRSRGNCCGGRSSCCTVPGTQLHTRSDPPPAAGPGQARQRPPRHWTGRSLLSQSSARATSRNSSLAPCGPPARRDGPRPLSDGVRGSEGLASVASLLPLGPRCRPSLNTLPLPGLSLSNIKVAGSSRCPVRPGIAERCGRSRTSPCREPGYRTPCTGLPAGSPE